MIEKLYQEDVISGWITDPFTRKTEPIIAESRTPNNYEIMRKINEIIDHINRLERVPASNVQEVQVRHGRWTHASELNNKEIVPPDNSLFYVTSRGTRRFLQGFNYCSCCYHEISETERLTPFCPNCGAKMNEEE